MTQRLWHESEILTALAAGTTLVAASERLARAVRLSHAHACREQGRQVWERPAVLSWNGFLHSLFSLLEETALGSPEIKLPSLLGAAQAEALWESVIRDSDAAGRLLQPAATAREAGATWELCCGFHILPDACNGAFASDDSREFAAWAREFLRRCGRRGLLEEARLPDYLIGQIKAVGAALPTSLMLTGFDEFTPQQNTLLTALEARGVHVQRLTLESGEIHNAQRVQCTDVETEMRAAAQWVRAILEQKPDVRIGIVVQDLASVRNQFVRILEESLCPGVRMGESLRRPYSLSLGRPLAECAVVHDGLALLESGRRRLRFDTASLLLRSPFFAAADSEQDAHARLELRLRDYRAQSIALLRLAELAKQHAAPRLGAALEAGLAVLAEVPTTQTASGWARSFSRLLKALGWPGERSPDSDEFQMLEAFREVLSEFARLDRVLGSMPFSAALTHLRRMAAQHMFQPLSAEVPVQVLGMPETAGLRFDYLSIMGLSDDTWPASPRPNAFIPWSVQRRLQLPHATAQRELEYAERQTRRLLACTSQAIVSSAERDGDAPLRPSPLIADLPLVEIETLIPAAAPAYQKQLQAQNRNAVLRFADNTGPPLQELAQVRGGTGVLKSQAACPFQAFAQYRLGAEPLNVPGPGLDAMARGALLHKVLEQLWGEIKDQAQLVKLDEPARVQLVQDCVTRVIRAETIRYPELYTPNFRTLEAQRLNQLLLAWLAVETQRSAFTVQAREISQETSFGPLRLLTRVDRIDELADGGRVIIDYKTGNADPNDWLGERPDEPQLPVYAISNRERLSGMLFAHLRSGDCSYAGFAVHDDIAPGIYAYAAPKRHQDAPADWPALLGHWQATITRLADDFSRGEAQLDPKRGPDTCARCHLSVLCRIHERDDGMIMETGGDD